MTLWVGLENPILKARMDTVSNANPPPQTNVIAVVSIRFRNKYLVFRGDIKIKSYHHFVWTMESVCRTFLMEFLYSFQDLAS